MTDPRDPVDPIDSFSRHEAMHVSWLMLDMFDRHVLDHRAIAANPAWADLAQAAHDQLWALYQKVGLDSLGPAPESQSGEQPGS